MHVNPNILGGIRRPNDIFMGISCFRLSGKDP